DERRQAPVGAPRRHGARRVRRPRRVSGDNRPVEGRSPGVEYYERHGSTYSATRRTDPRIAAQIHAALGDARTVVNVGAGTGSYEPRDREVIAVEPSEVMIGQRGPSAPPAIRSSAYPLPFEDGSFDAATAILTVHHWD